MPRFTPFPALRYRSNDLTDLIAPPYDVLSEAELDELNARSPQNITHVDVPREDKGPARYDQAAATLKTWIADEVMVADEIPTFTIYRLTFADATGADREIVGVLGGCEVGPYGATGVHAHERITPKASTDRLDLTRATDANLSPIWGLSLATGLTDLLVAPGELLASIPIDGVTHTVERIADPDRVAAISSHIASDDIVIADGHHRYGVAQQHRDDVRATGDTDSAAEETLMFVSELVEQQLSVEAIHRLYSSITADHLLGALSSGFDTAPAGTVDDATLAQMNERNALCFVEANGSGTWLTPKQGAFNNVRSLDGVWLEHLLAGVDHDVSYQHGVDRVVDAVKSGAAAAAVLIRPVSIAEIQRTAREGIVMPPKSTFFTPKLLTGLVIRQLR